MHRKADCDDSALMESFLRTVKTDKVLNYRKKPPFVYPGTLLLG
jgi:hypothetical protein